MTLWQGAFWREQMAQARGWLANVARSTVVRLVGAGGLVLGAFFVFRTLGSAAVAVAELTLAAALVYATLRHVKLSDEQLAAHREALEQERQLAYLDRVDGYRREYLREVHRVSEATNELERSVTLSFLVRGGSRDPDRIQRWIQAIGHSGRALAGRLAPLAELESQLPRKDREALRPKRESILEWAQTASGLPFRHMMLGQEQKPPSSTEDEVRRLTTLADGPGWRHVRETLAEMARDLQDRIDPHQGQ